MRRYIILIAFLFALEGCGQSEPDHRVVPLTPTHTPTALTATPMTQVVGDPARGKEIFLNGGEHENYKPQYYCGRCHSLDGGDGYGPTLHGIGARAGIRVPGLSPTEYLLQSILEPDAYIIEGFNENMGSIHRVLLSESEVNDLIAFLLTQ